MDLSELVSIAETLSPEALDTLIHQAKILQDKSDGNQEVKASNQQDTITNESEKNTEKPKRTRGKIPRPKCLKCGSNDVVLDGRRNGKQRYWCKSCNVSFMETTNTSMWYSHFNRKVWVTVIEDTFNGESLAYTAEKLEICVQTAFNMRHKVLAALVKIEEKNPIKLENISEVDETYVLESEKGHKFGEDAKRPPRKRGSKASKPGLSDEQVCIFSGVERNKGKAYATTVNRAKSSKEKIREALSGHIQDGSVLFTDGIKGYSVLQEDIDCIVNSVSVEQMKSSKTASLNNVNSFHSFVKERYRKYRGVATKYINRYNIMFAEGFRRREEVINEVCDIILTLSPEDNSTTITEILEEGLVDI